MAEWVYVHGLGGATDGHLHCWGRSPTGWWGLLVYRVRARTDGRRAEWLSCAVWITADELRLPFGRKTQQTRQIHLPANRLDWPSLECLPRRWDGEYLGIVETPCPAPLPDGYERVFGFAPEDYPA